MRLVINLSKDSGRAIDFIEITMRPDFKNAVQDLRKKWSINPDTLSGNSKEAEDEWLHFMESSELRADVDKLLSKLDLPSSWEKVVHQHVVDDMIFPYNDESRSIVRNSDGLIMEVNTENANDIILRVGPDTVFDDFKAAWQEIQQHRKQAAPRKRERKNFLRDYDIFRMARDGQTIVEIDKAIEAKYGKNGVDYGNIKKIVSGFYSRLKVPPEDRRELKTR